MHKRELERQLLAWSKEQAELSGYRDWQTQRIYQMGLLLGLLSSVCEEDYWAKRQVLKKINRNDR